MKDHPHAQRLLRVQIDGRTGQANLFLGIGGQFLSQHGAQIDTLPVRGRQQVLRVGQGHQPRLEQGGEGGDIRRAPRRLMGDGLHRGQCVLHPVIQFVDQQSLQAFAVGQGGEGLTAIGDVGDDARHLDRPARPTADQASPQMDPPARGRQTPFLIIFALARQGALQRLTMQRQILGRQTIADLGGSQTAVRVDGQDFARAD